MKKTKERKAIIVTIILIIVAIFAITIWFVMQKNEVQTGGEVVDTTKEEFVNVLEDGTKLNNSTKLAETKNFEGMEITNFQLTEKDSVSLLLGTITNTSDSVKGGYPIIIKMIDKSENEIVTVGGFVKELQPGESTQLSISATFDYANAYDFEMHRK